MRIIFDNIIYSLQHYGGISVVWNNLVSRVVDAGHNVTFLEYNNASQNISRETLQLPTKNISKGNSFLLPLRRYLNPHLSPAIFESHNGQPVERFIFHSSYFRICKHPKAINITTVHDFTYELFVNNWMKRSVHCRQKHEAIRKADHVVCISENTRRDLLRLLPDVNPSKVSVIYNGVERNVFHPLPDVQHEDFALFVGRRDEYKNFMKIIQPLSELHIRLIIVGSPLSKAELKLLTESKIDHQYLGIVSYERLNQLYNQALFLFFPSQYEGFGLPVLEAQMAGCPVLAYNASSIPEIIGDSTLMIDEFSKEQIAERIKRFKNPETRERIIAEGIANASRFTWDEMALQYMELYKKLTNE